ncbi:MAG: hypothetical protein JWM51_2257 [Microbacteriaceae bacterium]|jgi:hypothetical protein|nr:hypothetical protein [Microbacteriaceae bacterium]
MIETFLRPPRSLGEYLADVVRVVGVLSVTAAAVWWQLADVAVVALALIGVFLPRFLGARPAFDAAFTIAVLVASWSSVLDLYRSVVGWDVVVHFFTNGLIAAMAYLLLARLGVLPAVIDSRYPTVAAIGITTTLGFTAGVVWEFVEWAGHTFVDETIFVAYADTIGDLAAGGAGSLLAGLALRFLTAHNRSVASPRRTPTFG